MEITVELLLIFFAIALVAGWVDTLAGGGGLIALPALMMAGVPPLQALATNKCQGVVGTLTSTLTLLFKRRLPTQELLKLMLWTALGAFIGTWLIQRVSTDWLGWAVPILLLAVALYFLLTPKLGLMATPAKMSALGYRRTVVPLIGFYDGFFGPGTGSFFATSGVLLRGKTLIESTVIAKPLNCTSNVVSLALFIAGGQVVWALGIAMMCGQMVGAFLGAHSIYWGGAKLIRPLVIIMCVAMSIRQLVSLLP